MKKSLFSAIAMSTALVLGGCASTSSNLTKVNGEFVYPSMPILSEKPFAWNDNDSEALNIVKMARPAGIGNSLKDLDDGKKATIGSISGTVGLMDAAIGLVGGGLFTVVQTESLRQGVNQQVEFKPAIVEVVPKSLVYENNAPAYDKVRNHIAKKVMAAVEVEHSEIKWGGVYSLYNGVKKYDLTLVIESEKECKAERTLVTGDKDATPFKTGNLQDRFVDGDDVVKSSCSFGFTLFIPHETENDETVIVAEMRSGSYFVESIVNNYEGFVVIPDQYHFNGDWAMKTDYAFVAKKGKQLLFQK